MNILITGSNGQLGNELQRLESLHPNHRFFNTDVDELDITNAVAVRTFLEEHQIEGVVNCAAYTDVNKAESDPERCRLLNAEAPTRLAEAIEKRGGWMIQISTDYVFDGTACTPYTEEMPTAPASTYGESKLQGEQGVMSRCRQAMVIRTAWLYSSFGPNFVKTMLRLGKERTELGVVFDQIGTPTYARDLAKAILSVIEQGIRPGIYHYTNEGVASWYDFTLAILRLAGITTCRVKPIHTAAYPTPAQRPHYSVLDKTKIKDTFRIDIPHWEESLKSCIENL